MKFREYRKPASLAEAYALYRDTPGSLLLGGCTLLNRKPAEGTLGIDLSGLGLDEICESGGTLMVGAAASFSEVERTCSGYWNGILRKAVPALGAPLKNIITVGGAVAGRLGMSDILTVLLALGANVRLYAGGALTLESYLDGPLPRDIVTAVEAPLDVSGAAFQAMRNACAGPPLLHVAAAVTPQGVRVAVGSRPGPAVLAPGAGECASRGGAPEEAARIAAAEVPLADDMHATDEYRRMLCEALAERALREAMA